MFLCDLQSPPKRKVILTGLDQNQKAVYQIIIDSMEYYESTHSVLDEETTLRLKFGIRFVQGKIYNYDGILDQEFQNNYGEDGRYLGGHIKFADGTEIET